MYKVLRLVKFSVQLNCNLEQWNRSTNAELQQGILFQGGGGTKTGFFFLEKNEQRLRSNSTKNDQYIMNLTPYDINDITLLWKTKNDCKKKWNKIRI